MTLKYVRMADLNTKEGLTPNYPFTLDTEFDPDDPMQLTRVSNPWIVDAVIKLHGLFTPHIVLNEAQVLDHSGMRAYFKLLESRSELVDALRYFSNPGKDKLGLGPLVLAGERFSPEDPTHEFPLVDLLARKLGANDPERHPWELSSFWNARGPKRHESRSYLRQLEPSERLAAAVSLLEPSNAYAHYLELASEIWDVNADVTRVALPPPDYPAQLERLVLEHKECLDREAGETAEQLLQLIKNGSSTPLGSGLKLGINKSTVHLWLRKQSVDGLLYMLATRAHPEAFILAFPSKRGWNSTHDPQELAYIHGPESASPPKMKHTLDEAISTAAQEMSRELKVDDAGPIFLPNLRYKDLKTLRDSVEFQSSLDRLQSEWRECHDLDHIGRVVHEHIKLIWDLLRYSRRSSSFFGDGPSVIVRVFRVADDVLSAHEVSSLASHLRPENAYMLFLGPIYVVLKHLCVWAAPTVDWKQMRQAANLIVGQAVIAKE
jgi:hypothetical protein